MYSVFEYNCTSTGTPRQAIPGENRGQKGFTHLITRSKIMKEL